MQVRKYIQARYILVAVPATLALSAVAIGQSATKHGHNHVTSTTQLETSGTSKPNVTVNGHHVDVPAGGSATVRQGDGQTTVSVAPAASGQPAGGSETTTTTPDGTVNISVTSNTGSGSHSSHSFASVDSNADTFSNVHQSVTVQKTGTGSVHASN